MTGGISILNVGVGDTKLVFDNSDPDEKAKSAKIVKDMIRRGFVLLIEVGHNEKGPIYQRAKDFDENTAEYIVAGMADDAPEENDVAESPAKLPRRRAGRKAPATARIPAASTNAVAVARTAGG